jgi:transglutaminase/protease-like cytokinesis protein 3
MFSIDQKLNLHFLSNSKGDDIIYKCSISLSSQNEKNVSLSKCGMKGGSIKIFWDEGLMNW